MHFIDLYLFCRKRGFRCPNLISRHINANIFLNKGLKHLVVEMC